MHIPRRHPKAGPFRAVVSVAAAIAAALAVLSPSAAAGEPAAVTRLEVRFDDSASASRDVAEAMAAVRAGERLVEVDESVEVAALPGLSWRPLLNTGTGDAVTVSGWPPSKADGGRLWMGPYGDPWWHQEWWFGPKLGGDAYQMMARHSEKCMDIQGPSNNDLVPVHQWACYQADNQFWYFHPVYIHPDTRLIYWRIQNAQSLKCLDIAGMSTQPKAYLQQYTCKSTSDPGAWNQTFAISGVYAA